MIPEAAVEAAMRVLSMYIDERMSENDPNSKYTREGAVEILEAAAPYMMAEAWQDGATDGHLYGTKAKNPYRNNG